jgi:hypothetical protein
MGDNLPEPYVLVADRGYDTDNVRKTIEARNVMPGIPMRKIPKVAPGRRPRSLQAAEPRRTVIQHVQQVRPPRRKPMRQDRRELRRNHVDPRLAPPFVNITYTDNFPTLGRSEGTVML